MCHLYMTSSRTSYYFKSMMINISINIKFRKEFKCLLVMLTLWQGGMIAKNRHKMWALKMVSRWTTEVTGWPVGRWSGSTICMPVTSLGVSPMQENQCTNTHGHFSPYRVNEKKRCTWATSRPMILHTDVEDNEPPSLSVLSWAALINKVL